MANDALKLTIFSAFVVLMGWKAVRGVVATEAVVKNRAFGDIATKPLQAGVLAVAMSAACYGGYVFAEFPYLWLAIALINLFAAFLVLGQSRVHDRDAGLDAELSLALDQAQMAKKIRARRWASAGQIVVILVWAYAWRDALAIA